VGKRPGPPEDGGMVCGNNGACVDGGTGVESAERPGAPIEGVELLSSSAAGAGACGSGRLISCSETRESQRLYFQTLHVDFLFHK
jgi:hypothetical protein